MPETALISVVTQARGNLHAFVAQRLTSARDEVGRLGAELERIEQDDPEFGRQIRDRWRTGQRVGDVSDTIGGNATNVIQAREINGTVNFDNQA